MPCSKTSETQKSIFLYLFKPLSERNKKKSSDPEVYFAQNKVFIQDRNIKAKIEFSKD